MSEVEEGAKAAGAIAETAGKGIDAGRELGKFIGNIFGPALEELGGALHDRVKLYRAERLLRFRDRFEAIRAELGMQDELQSVPLKFGAPLLEAAALEENGTLCDMFATLLANATAPGGETVSRRTFVSILENLEPLDAKVLLAAYNSPPGDARQYPVRTIYTARLPSGFMTKDDPELAGSGGKVILPPPDIELALWNLSKQGCIAPAGLWGGASSIGVVTVTALGVALIEASTPAALRNPFEPSASASDPAPAFRV